MSAYRNFVQDYPERCLRLLEQNFKNAEGNGLEVTLLLNIASSGIILPYCRLREDSHPSGDQNRFVAARDHLSRLLETPFLSFARPRGRDPGSWQFGKLGELEGDPDGWGLERLQHVTPKKEVSSLVKVLRNALAHGNIFTRGWPNIETLVFLSRVDCKKPELGYNCLRVSPADLKEFVLNWLRALSQAGIPEAVFVEANSFAELVA